MSEFDEQIFNALDEMKEFLTPAHFVLKEKYDESIDD